MQNDGLENKDVIPQYIREFLKQPPHIMRNFHNEDVLAFLNLGIEERFMKDEVIVNESQFVNSAYLVATGKVSIWKDNIDLATLNKGDFIGETFLFSKNNRMAKVVAQENETIMLRFERYEVLNFFRKKPEKLFNIFTKNIIEIQQKKISNMNVQLLKLKKRLLNENSW